MLSIFKKKLFSDISGTAEDMPPHVSAVLCLMIGIARMDGKVDDEEMIKYKQDGENKEMKAGSAKTMEKDHPAKIEYDKLVDDEDTEGPEKDPTSVAGQQLQSDPKKGGTYMKKKDDVEDVDVDTTPS